MAGARLADTHALEEWVVATAPRAVAYARSLLQDLHQAEDVVQDCYCRLIARQHEYDLVQDGTKLLYRSISNACINLKSRRKPMYSLVVSHDQGEEQQHDPADPAALEPVSMVAAGELQQTIAELLAQLPPQQRAAIELKSLGYTQQEIAEILEVSPSNAGVLIHRARSSLAKSLANQFDPAREETP